MNEQNKKAAVDTGEKSIKARLFGDLNAESGHPLLHMLIHKRIEQIERILAQIDQILRLLL